jgi:hypothetical protein
MLNNTRAAPNHYEEKSKKRRASSLTWAHRRQRAFHPQVQELLVLRPVLLVLRQVPLVPRQVPLDLPPVRLVPLLWGRLLALR